MERIVGIICEYNPFHSGHLYQIEMVKNKIPGAKIVAIMSGNTTQRGQFSMLSKYKRAEIALESGVDLVLEMPFPYSSSAAENFATAGVKIAAEIGCTDLCFGTENCDIDYISSVANAIDSCEFENAISKELGDKKTSYIVARERALQALGFNSLLFANDMLGVEYVRAINKIGATITPFAIKRTGAGYNDLSVCDVMSASAIRTHFYKENTIIGVPSNLEKYYLDAIVKNEFIEEKVAKDFLFRFILTMSQKKIESCVDSSKEIASIIKSIADESKNGEEFFENLSTKTYTRARLSRVVMFTLFGITKIDKNIRFALLLGANKNGREILSNAKKSNVKIITKHSDSSELDSDSQNILETLYEVDKLYNSLLRSEDCPLNAYKQKPIIK